MRDGTVQAYGPRDEVLAALQRAALQAQTAAAQQQQGGQAVAPA
jgi:ATP-binding cassette subfamily C exporter for protease/lipase